MFFPFFLQVPYFLQEKLEVEFQGKDDWLGIQIRPSSTSSINENQEYVS